MQAYHLSKYNYDFVSSLPNLVKVPPKLEQVPKDTKLGVGQRAHFHCSTTRDHSVSEITWNKLSNHVTGKFDLIIVFNENFSFNKIGHYF